MRVGKRFLLAAAALLLFPDCSSRDTGGQPSSSGSGPGGGNGAAASSTGASSTGAVIGSDASSSMGADGGADLRNEDEGGDGGDNSLIVPEGLTIMPLAGGTGVLDLFALTLHKGPSSTDIYVALKNSGDSFACDAAFSVDLYDKDQQPLASSVRGLYTKHFYRLTDGSDTIAACVGPGDVTMAALTDLPADIEVEYVVYQVSYFNLDVVPIDGLAISGAQRVATDTGTAYAGTFVNGFDVAVTDPSVTVFPVNPAGRPLGVARATGDGTEIAPGGSWDFGTSAVDAPGTDFVAYPTAAIVH